MRPRRRIVVAVVALFVCVSRLPFSLGARAATEEIPSRLSDKAFW